MEGQGVFNQMVNGGAAIVYNKTGSNLKVHANIQAFGTNTVPNPPVTNTDSYNWFTQVGSNHGSSGAGDGTRSVLDNFICPSDILPRTDNNGYGKSNYCASLGDEQPWIAQLAAGGPSWSVPNGNTETGVFRMANDNNNTYMVTIADIIDGTSNVIAVGEVSVSSNVDPLQTGRVFPIWAGGNNDWAGQWRISSWARVAGANCFINNRLPAYYNGIPNGPIASLYTSDFSFGSQHPGGAQFVLADGSVRFISEAIDSFTYACIANVRDGNPIKLN
jgi:prepilin-type processing-associated H-X9-DG protein